MELQDIDLKELIENETRERFNRQGYIKCPFHSDKTPSLSIKFHSNKNKWKFKCFGCGASGDVIDFISELKGIDFIEAKKYLGLEAEKSQKELLEEKVKGYIDWELGKFRAGQELLGIFSFVDKIGNPLYYKVKFKKPDGEKCLSYYHIENDKVVSGRGTDEVPYNLCNTLTGMSKDSTVVITEGEKDANTINSLLKKDGYVATSVKGCKDIEVLANANIYVCGDTGQAGGKYKWEIYKKLFGLSTSFKFINLPAAKDLGDNKDVTDWIEAGHTKEDLLNAFNRSLDFKNKYELQQDGGGIYKMVYNKKSEEYDKVYITNFKLLEATRISFVNEDQEGVKLILKSPTGQNVERVGLSTVFDDVRTFKNFLGTLDLAFTGRIETLTELKIWINKYFALETEEIYSGMQFKIKDNELLFITNNGAIGENNIHKNIKSDGRNDVQAMDLVSLTKEEIREIKKYIFRFASPDKTISIIGTIINNLAIAQCKELKIKLHHLLIIGEAGSGKSTILERVVAAILNYAASEIKSLGLASNFSLIKDLSDGNYTMIYEEHKPSRWDRYKISKISEVLRNLYDGSSVARGDKSLKTKNFILSRPIVIAGEEGYYNNEKALLDRSCIIYTSKHERTNENSKAMKWLIENETLLNRLGRDLMYTVLSLSVEEYRKMRNKIETSNSELKDRPLNTALNIAMGIEILNILFKNNGIKTITDYMQHIEKNIKAEILDGGSEAHSVVEQMLVLYNDMIDDGRAVNTDEVVRYRGDGIFIKTSEMVNQIKEHINRVGAEITPLGLKDFKKQAAKAGYLLGNSDKLIKVGTKAIRFDTYCKERLRGLNVNSIVPQEIEEVIDNVVPFK